MKKLLAKIRKILHDRRTRRFLTRFVSGIAALVVFVTTYALVLPAITMEKVAACGIEEHQHDDSCYSLELVCGLEESDGHKHDDSCYSKTSTLICGTKEHEHSVENGCYDDEGNLICEITEHRHSEECYEEVRELTCQIPESEGHRHTDECYEKVLACGKEVHIHSTACYENDPVSEAAVAASTGSASAATTSAGSVSSAGMTLSFEGEIEETIDIDEPVDDDKPDSDGSVNNTGSDEINGLSENDGSSDNDGPSENGGSRETTSSGVTDAKDSSDAEVTYGSENAGTGQTEASNAALTNTDNSSTSSTSQADTDQYIPQLDAIDLSAVLNSHTGIYYHHVADEETVEDSSAVPAEGWNRIPNNIDRLDVDEQDVELGKNDLLRVYLSYTIPAGSLNATNPVARYRLPSNLHLTDPQVKAINENVNGVAAQYVDMSNLEITDPDKYNACLGLEAVEGTRTPDKTVEDYLREQVRRTGTDAAGADADDAAEYISAVVRVENVYDTDGIYGEKDAYLGQDLIFTFVPYSIEKNQHEYDSTGKPTKAGKEIEGWFTFDLNMGQVDFEEPEITTSTVEAPVGDNDIDNGDAGTEDDHIENDNTDGSYVEDNGTRDDLGTVDPAEDAPDAANPAIDDQDDDYSSEDNNPVVSEDDVEAESAEEDPESSQSQNQTITKERAERTAEIVFVEEGWDEKGNVIDQISTTLKVVEETEVEPQDPDQDDDQDSDNEKVIAETATEKAGEANTEENAGETATEDKSAAEEDNTDKNKDQTDKGETTQAAEESEPVAIMPAMSFSDSIKVTTGRPAGIDEKAGGTLANAADALPKKAEVFVRVEADEGTFPAGTTMVLKAVSKKDMAALSETVADTVEKESPDAAEDPASKTEDKQENKENQQNSDSNANTNIKTYGFQAVDITFLDKDGNEIQPEKPVRVALTSKVVEQVREEAKESMIADPVVVHVDDEGNAEQMDLVEPEEIEPAKGRTEEELLEGLHEEQKDQTETEPDNTSSNTVSDPQQNKTDETDDTSPNDETIGNTSTDASTDDAAEESALTEKEDAEAENNAESTEESYVDTTAERAVDSSVESNAGFTVENNVDSSSTAATDGTHNVDESIQSNTANTAEDAVDNTPDETGTAAFTTDTFSVYAIVYTVELYTNIITDSGETYRITVTYDETSGIPQDAELRVREIKKDDKEYANYYAEAMKTASGSLDARNRVNSDNNGDPDTAREADYSDKPGKAAREDSPENPNYLEKAYARFFDIEIWSDGQKVEPSEKVSVSVRLLDVPENDEKRITKIIHFDKNGPEIISHTEIKDNAEIADKTKTEDNTGKGDSKEQNNSDAKVATDFNFTASSFSVYSVVSYTVDFYWEVDGKLYQFSLPGGGFVSLQQLVEVLGITRALAVGQESDDNSTLATENADTEDHSSFTENSDKANGTEEDNSDDNGAVESRVLTLEDVVISDETRKFVADVEKVEFSSPELAWIGKAGKTTSVGALKEDNKLAIQYSAELTEEQIEKINAQTVEAGDWALISMLPFESEEALTITMKTGEEFVIRVTDYAEYTPVEADGVTIPNPSGTTMNLFDYWVAKNRKNNTGKNAWPGYTGNGNPPYNSYTHNGQTIHGRDSNNGNYIEGNNSGINSWSGNTAEGHALKFNPSDQWTVIDGVYKRPNTNTAWNQRNVNGDRRINSWVGNADPLQGLVQPTLNANGYPKLTNDRDLGTNGEDLDYLFDRTEGEDMGKKVYPGVNNLLYVDRDGYYTYDSRDFAATYNESSKKFSLTRFADSVSGGPRGFWPFGSEKFWLGLHMKVDFSMPYDGRVLNPSGVYKDIEFSFSGDDDTWIYVDDILVGDGGGVHNRTEIDINFRRGTVRVTGTEEDSPYTGTMDETTYLEDYYRAQNKFVASEWTEVKDDQGNTVYREVNGQRRPVLTFANSSEHTLQMFYMERGGGFSNLMIHYNLISTTEFSAHKSLQSSNSVLKRDQYKFEVIGFDNNAYSGEVKHAIMPGADQYGDEDSETGLGTYASPKYSYSTTAPGGVGVPAGAGAYRSVITGVAEDGNVNFGNLGDISNAYAGKEYYYMVREIIPDTATKIIIDPDTNEPREITWGSATPEQKAEGGFKDANGVTYDGKIYYFKGVVEETAPNSGKYKLKKYRYIDPDYTIPDEDTAFHNFVNGLQPLTLKVQKKNPSSEMLQGAAFSLTRAKGELVQAGEGTSSSVRWVPRNGAKPITGTTSADGTLSFNGLMEDYYILEETAPPAGYLRGDTYRWLVKVLKQESNNNNILVPSILALDAQGNVQSASPAQTLTVSNNVSVFEVLNTPHEPIEIGVEKKWQNEDRTDVANLDDYSATFTLKRLKSWTESTTAQGSLEPSSTLKIGYYYNDMWGNPSYGYYTNQNPRQYVVGTSASVSYNYNDNHNNYNNNWRRYRVIVDDQIIAEKTDDIGDWGSISITMPAEGKTISVYLYDNWRNGSTFTSLTPNGQIPQYTTIVNYSTHLDQEDDDFSCELSLSGGTTTGRFVNPDRADGKFPVIETKTVNGKQITYTYKYYIEETETNKPEDSGKFETIYVINGKEISEAEYLAHKKDNLMPDGGTQTVINRKLINVPVEKIWPDYERDNNAQSGGTQNSSTQDKYSWEATLQLDYRDVPLDDPNHPSEWTPYHIGENHENGFTGCKYRKTLRYPSANGTNSSDLFEDLPMYSYNSEGKACRREYSVVELSYTVWKYNNSTGSYDYDNPVASYVASENEGETGTVFPEGYKYTLWYEHDAGEDSNYDDEIYPDKEDYNISVFNLLEHRDVKKDITIDLQKEWEGVSPIPNDYKATFRLRRNVLVEYRNYEYATNDRVTVNLQTADGTLVQTLDVPPGHTMYVRGLYKNSQNVENIVFTRSDGGDDFHAEVDNTFSGYSLFAAEFTAPASANPTLTVTLDASSEAYVIGGKDGLLLSDSNDRQNLGIDSTFSKEFELSNEKGWRKHYPEELPAPDPDDPQAVFEHDHQLPSIELSTLDADGKTANIYIYTYFFEEISRQPENFYATFTDEDNNILGDKEHQIFISEKITATNRPISFDVLKVDEERLSATLPGAVFNMRRLKEGNNGGYPVTEAHGTFVTYPDTPEVFDSQTTAQGTGIATFSSRPSSSGSGSVPGIPPGYYEVKETIAPDGYVMTETVVFYVHVEKTGHVKLLKKQAVAGQEGVMTLTLAEPVEQVGKVTYTSTPTINGLSIVYTVRNEPGAELPSCGGIGIQLFYRLGIMFTALAAIGLLIKRSRKAQKVA